jgi:hypothetical protein
MGRRRKLPAASREVKSIAMDVRGRQSVLLSQQNHGSAQRAPGETAAAAARRGKARFLSSFAALKDLVGRACAREDAWEAKVVAGLRAVLEFAASDPQGAHALTVDARRRRSGQIDLEQEAISYFAVLLREVVAADRRFPISTEEAIIESIATIIRGHLQLGTARQLPDLAPDLVYITLMPYLGISEARRWASSSLQPTSCGT